MGETKPTILIVHGMWQNAEGWIPFLSQLQAEDLSAVAPSLPSIGATISPLPGLLEDVSTVQAVLTQLVDEEKDIIVLCHSYGGVVGSCAVEGFDTKSRAMDGKKGGVVKIVYMTAMMLPKGGSLLEGLGGQPLPWMTVEGGKVFAPIEHLRQVAFNDFSDELADLGCSQITHVTFSIFNTPSTYEPWKNGMPCAYIFCTKDNAIPLPKQQEMSNQIGSQIESYTLNSGHCPWMSVPDQLIEVLKKVVIV